MNPLPAARAVVDLLRDEGVDRVFGNPGTTELPLLQELARDGDPDYVLALQEFTAVAAADGYARGTGRPAFVSVHAVPGVSNALIGMNNARRSRTPLVITAGQQDQRFLRDSPMLGGDLVGLAAPACLAADEVHTADDLLPMFRRAFARARGVPSGPVFVSVPMNLLAQPAAGPIPARPPIVTLPVATGIDEAAALLAGASNPAIMAGDRVGATGALRELTAVAEALGATVYPQPQYEHVDADTEHPLTAPAPPFVGSEINKALAGHDALLLAGASIRSHLWTPEPPLPEGIRVVQLDDDPAEIGRAHDVEIGLFGAVGPTLDALAEALRGLPGLHGPALERAGRISAELVPERTRWRERARAAAGPAPVHPATAAQLVADALAAGTVVVEEAVTSGPLLRRALPQRGPGDYHNSSGNGGLGWGIGAAVGLHLAHPGRPVLAFLGDGSAMFGVQGLWTAARLGAPVLFVVVNNHEYRTLKDSLGRQFGGMDLGDPAIDWVGLARSMGLSAHRVGHASEIGPAVRAAQESGGPRLVEIPIRGYGDGAP
jgi:benzoylformate decarboxylase